jgi:MoaA/NifB/PqqE/SkfB family radical SAM enzyme
MITYYNVKEIHIEVTSLCNARCPLCVRNANGYPHNFGYPETSLSLEQVKQIFPVEFVQQLRLIDFCGNFGDFVMAPDGVEIVEYFRSINKSARITIGTNGSARDKEYWARLGKTNVEIVFALDGLEDTHSLYRVDTNWKTVIRNAKIAMENGSKGVWKMIKFNHNSHQIDECRKLAAELGFDRFDSTDHGRDSGSVFDRKGNLTHILGDPAATAGLRTTESLIQWKAHMKPYVPSPESDTLDCMSTRSETIFIAANGEVYPCCYLGAYPKTYKNGSWYELVHTQLKEIVDTVKNNALEVGLKSAIEWFNQIEERWNIKKYKDGRLILCDSHCGKNFKHVTRYDLKNDFGIVHTIN